MSTELPNEPVISRGAAPGEGSLTLPALADRGRRRLALVLTLIGGAVWLWSLGQIDPSAVTGLGLLSVVGSRFLVALAILSIAFAVALSAPRPSGILILGQIVLLVVVLHGSAALVEEEGRYPIAYLHAGFIDYISAHGATLPGLDARFSWPGFFALGAVLTDVSGIGSPVELIRFAPLFFELLYLAPLWAIASWATNDVRARWLAILLFYLFNWIGQDYLAPQALAMFLYLAFLAILLRWFGRKPVPRDRRHVAVLLLLVLIYVALVASHQLTPVALGLTVAALSVAGLLSLPTLPILMACIFLAWLSFAAEPYWAGHFTALVGGGHGVAGNVDANVAARFSGDESRRVVLDARVGMSAVLVAVAALGLLPRWRPGPRAPTVALCAAMPFPIVLVQGYGGEALLRAYLYALPFLAILAASVLVRLVGARSPGAAVGGFGEALAICAVGFLIARYGNEQFERVPRGDLAAVEYVYEHASRGAMLAAASENLPWRYHELNGYAYTPVTDAMISDPQVLLDALGSRRVGYFIASHTQEVYGEQIKGLPPGWLDRLVRRLESTRAIRRVYRSGGASVFQYKPRRSSKASG